MSFLQNLFNPIINALTSILGAVGILLLALIVAYIAKAVVVKGGRKLGLERYTDKIGISNPKGSLNFIGNIVFFIVFILFFPGILDSLNMQGVSQPIVNMTTTLLAYLPNIFAAVLIFIVGFFIAKVIKNFLLKNLDRFNINRLQSKAGIDVDENTMKLSTLIANIVYVLILLPVFVAAFEALNITAISAPALNMLNMIINMIPLVLVAVILIVIGVYIGKMAGNLLAGLLSSVGLDGFIKSILGKNGEDSKFSLSKIIGEILRYLIIILFAVEAFNVAKLEIFRVIGTAIITYLPSLISALIIIGVGVLFATWLENLMLNSTKVSKFVAGTVKYIIIVVAVFMMLNQLGFANEIVNTAFIVILGALAIAFAIAFGIGGREFAQKILNKLYDKVDNKDNKGQ